MTKTRGESAQGNTTCRHANDPVETLAYLPAPKGKNNPCRRCPGYPRTDAQGGVTVSFGSGQVQSCFGDLLHTVGEALDRIACRLGLAHAKTAVTARAAAVD